MPSVAMLPMTNSERAKSDAAAAAMAEAARTVMPTYVVNVEPALSRLEVIAELELVGGVGSRRRPTPLAGHAPEVGARR
jgi:hypothetical protein